MEKTPAFRLEPYFAFFLLVGGVAISAVSWEYGFGSLAQPGPGLYPFFVGAAIAACSLMILRLALKSGAGGLAPDRGSARTLARMVVTFCFWILAMPLLGYVVVSLLAAYAFCKILGLEGWRRPLAVSAGTALFIYVLFDVWLYVDLPRGILG